MALNLGNFTPQGRAMSGKGLAMAGGTGPVRRKKAPNLLQAILGVFFGIALVVLSPMAMWQAQSQSRAKDFSSATVVEATSGDTGYITFESAPSYAAGITGDDCYINNCIHEKASYQELVTNMKIECKQRSSIRESSTVRVISQNGSECDENGDCVPCFDVERDEWEEQGNETVSYDVMVGNFTVSPEGAIKLDTKETVVSTGFSEVTFNDTQTVYTTFVMPSTLLVAGDSDGSRVSPGEKIYVLSSYNSATTLEKLEAMDKAAQYVFWIVTFLMLFIGISLILGPLQWMGRQLRFIPLVGPMLSKGTSTVIGIASFLIAVPLWIILFIAVTILKLWWLGLLIVLALIGFFIWKAKKGDDAPESAE